MVKNKESMSVGKKAALIHKAEPFSPLSLSQVHPIAERAVERFFEKGSIIALKMQYLHATSLQLFRSLALAIRNHATAI